MAGVGEVITCANVQEWNEKIKEANESKKLVISIRFENHDLGFLCFCFLFPIGLRMMF